MKLASFILIALLLAPALVMSAMTTVTPSDEIPAGISVKQFDLMPLAFTKNNGQWDDRVQFKANAGGAAMWFTTDGVYYQFTRRILENETSEIPQQAVGHPLDLSGRQTSPSAPYDRFDNEPDSREQLVIKASFIGANLNPEIVGDNMMEYKCNYFIGNDPDEWHTNVPN